MIIVTISVAFTRIQCDRVAFIGTVMWIDMDRLHAQVGIGDIFQKSGASNFGISCNRIQYVPRPNAAMQAGNRRKNIWSCKALLSTKCETLGNPISTARVPERQVDGFASYVIVKKHDNRHRA